jgi:hypothetical protein
MIQVGGNKTTAVRLYPNPSPEKLFIEYEGSASDIYIYNMQGVECFHESVEGSVSLELNTAQWPKGVYLVKFSDEVMPSQRIIKN